MLAAEELLLLTSGVSPYICSHCDGSLPASPNEGDVRASEEYDPGEQLAGDSQGEGGSPSPISSCTARAAAQRGDLEQSQQLLHGLLLDALEGISFLTDQVACLTEENRRLRNEWARSTEQQTLLICSLRDEIKACRAQVGGLGKTSGASSFAAIVRSHSSPPASEERKLPHRPQANLQSSPPESGILALPQSTQSASGARGGAHSTPTPLKPEPPRIEPKSTASCQDGAPDGRVARLGPTRPKARTPALTGASETSKLSVASPSMSRRALFVTKLAPDTTCEDVSSHLSSIGLDKLECRRLKTWHDSYASFHVSMAAEDFVKLADPAVWPKSCLFKTFRGTLRQALLHVSEGPPMTDES
ncbi:hypothetical protein HPB47_005148 [Ixodes persulcatus]|uniref:Uncharacterized protein n=1 Tax=Ixodes persulcatus TaxID=34615 RepID=A0AC60PDV7_IXOPE|nr:hypothetical protein HPB47_005148 [Ixodes persulcatus]